MAYTSGIFYLDLVNGSDTARTALTGCIASNPSGTITRINKTAHGLVTGAIVDLTLFSAWLNGAFKITKVDNDNFDLDNTPWQTTADNNGTVTPRGGSSWTDAWKTFNLGATAARIAPSDTIRVAKSPDPISIGNATWTSKSSTVTLASAQTTNIYLDGSWTAANSATVTTTTTRKEGSNAAQITTPASTVTSTKYAYYTIGGGSGVDLSSYDAITFWIRNNTTAIADANRYTIRLCSDTLGDTTVDTFAIPAIASTNVWVSFTLTRNGGGALGSSIQSIALYTGTSSPGNSQQLWLDNVLACDADGLNLTSLISKNSAGNGGAEPWFNVMSINNTDVTLAVLKSSTTATSGRGYYTTGTSPETVTTYVRSTIKLTIQSGQFTGAQPLQDSGTAGNPIAYSGGWNTTNDTQDGSTWIDGQNGSGYGIDVNSKNYLDIERINVTGFSTGYNTPSSSQYITIRETNMVGCGLSGYFNANYQDLEFKAVACDAPFRFLGINSKISFIGISCTGSTTDSSDNYVFSNIEIYNQGGIVTFTNCVIENLIYQDSFGGIRTNRNVVITNASGTNNTRIFENLDGEVTINKLTASGNTALINQARDKFIVKQSNFSSSEIILSSISVSNLFNFPASFGSINNDPNDNRSYWAYGNALSQTTVRHTALGIAWQINITNTNQTSDFPIHFPIARVACNANALVTVKAWVKLSHATDIGAKLMIQKNEIAGVSANVTATKSADTNWEELAITFTPTSAGVAQIYIQGYWLANLADESIYVDDITVTQA